MTQLAVGDRVRLVTLEDGFSTDMDDDVITFLRSCIGSPTIWIDPNGLEKAAA